jgi:hypothetical protein
MDSGKERQIVIACEVMKPELEAVCGANSHVEIHYLDQALHRIPKQMPQQIQAKIDQMADGAGQIILGYGLCSNGVVGVAAHHQTLIVPRCHDCISFFLGSLAAYKKTFADRPGTYYLTPGWIEQKKDPLGIIEEEYTPRYGRETAIWVFGEELKHYTHIALIDTGVRESDGLRERAMENARFLKKEYIEIPGSLDYFRKLIHGPHTDEDFLMLDPATPISQDMFFTPKHVQC